MKLTDLFLEELDREMPVSRRVLENVPPGLEQWKPHPKSMQFGYLATLVATMPLWVVSTIDQDSLELQPEVPNPPKIHSTAADLVAALDDSVAKARQSLTDTSDEHLMTSWRLLVRGKTVLEQPRYIVLRDSVFNHIAHHRGQLSVYLRLNDAPVPSIYGPSADAPF
jgi:uncharacterized damage-inducible protein DinB